MNYRIAVIIPVYNVTTYLSEAIESAFLQDYPHKEIIVVDDGSSPDNAAEIACICATFKDTVLLHQPHTGPAAARHAGVLHTNAELIVFLDGDDVMMPGALSHFADTMQSHPEADACYGKYCKIDENGNITSESMPSDPMPSGKAVLLQLLERKYPFTCGTICMKREALLKLPQHNHRLKLGENWFLFCHLALAGNIIAAGNSIVMHYRVHPQNHLNFLLENPNMLLDAYDLVFKDPLFVKAIGKDELNRLREKCRNHAHARLAIAYAARGQHNKANYHLQKITSALSDITHVSEPQRQQ